MQSTPPSLWKSMDNVGGTLLKKDKWINWYKKSTQEEATAFYMTFLLLMT